MDIQIKTKNLRVGDGLEQYIHKRLEKLDKISERVVDAKLELRTEKNRSGGEQMVAQFTIATPDTTLRAEEKNHDLHTAIDLAVERMARQILRFHEKRIYNRRRQKARAAVPEETTLPTSGSASTEVEIDEETPVQDLVRRKRFKIQPMSEDEAIEQMELLGHDFFVFFNPDEAQMNVLYRRKDGQYGIIQPDIA